MDFEVADQNSIHILQVTFSSLRKINEDIIMNISSNDLSLRSVNDSRSALPIIIFHTHFFKVFNFTSSLEKIIISIPASSIIMAFKKALSPTLLRMHIKDTDHHLLYLTLVDKYGIAHNWEFPVFETSSLSAIVNLNDMSFQLKCRYDVFNGISDVFKSDNTIILDIKNGGKTPNTINFRTNFRNEDETSLSTTFTIYKCEKCDTVYSNDIKEMQISFFLRDFIVGIKLAALFAHFIYLYIIAPGQPIVIKSSSSNIFEFEMPLATTSIDDDDDGNEMHKFTNSYKAELLNNSNSSNSNSGTNSIPHFHNKSNYSTQSQVALWQHSFNEAATSNDKTNDSHQNNSCQIITKNSSSGTDENSCINLQENSFTKKKSSFSQTNSQKEFSNSEKVVNQLFEASPPFPYKRKKISQKIVVQASQPSDGECEFED